jgi:phosphate transport system substrate-binding protein
VKPIKRWARTMTILTALASSLGVVAVATPAQAVVPPYITAGGSDTTEQLMTQYLALSGNLNIPAVPGTPFLVPNEASPGTGCDTNADGNVSWATAVPPGEKVAPNGSSSGITELVAEATSGQNCMDIARSSRGPRVTDNAALHFYNYALDDIVPMTPGWYAPVSITKQQIKDIFLGSPVGSCSVTNWNQVGGGNYPITTYIPQAGSGTRAEFLNRWLDIATDPGVNGFPCVPATRQVAEENTGKAASIVSNGATLPGAITGYSAGKWVRQGNNFGNGFIDNRNGMHPIQINEAGCGGTVSPIVRTTGGSWQLNSTIVVAANATSNACPGVRFLWNVVSEASPQFAAASALVGTTSAICAGSVGVGNGIIRGQGFLPNVCSDVRP